MIGVPCICALGETLVFRVKRKNEPDWSATGYEFGRIIGVNKRTNTIKFQLLAPVYITLDGPDPAVIHHYCLPGKGTRFTCLIRFPNRFRQDEALVIPSQAKEAHNIAKLAFAFPWNGTPIETVQTVAAATALPPTVPPSPALDGADAEEP